MIAIKTSPINDQNLKNSLERIGDLINMDEPMLSLFKDNRSNDLYLFDWADADNKTNRWLVYKVNKNILDDFISKKVSFKYVFDSARNYFVTDIQGGQNPPFSIKQIEKLPTEYYPNTDLFFDESDAKNLPKIKSVLQDLIKKGNQQTRSVDSSKNIISVIRYINKYRAFEEQGFAGDIYITVANAELNDVTEKISNSNLFRKNDSELNRLLQKTRLDLQYK